LDRDCSAEIRVRKDSDSEQASSGRGRVDKREAAGVGAIITGGTDVDAVSGGRSLPEPFARTKVEIFEKTPFQWVVRVCPVASGCPDGR